MQKPKLIMVAIASVALVLSAWILSIGVRHFRSGTPTISVIGLSEREIKSDLMIWSITVNTTAQELRGAYPELQRAKTRVLSYLSEHGIQDDEMELSSVNYQKLEDGYYDSKLGEYRYAFKGYNLQLSITVRTARVDEVEQVYAQISELLSEGLDLHIEAPQYYYSGLDKLKMEMLQEASQDARARAEIIALGSGSDLGGISSSAQGVFQIVGKNTREDYSWGGTFNTSSKIKIASVTVRSAYKVQ